MAIVINSQPRLQIIVPQGDEAVSQSPLGCEDVTIVRYDNVEVMDHAKDAAPSPASKKEEITKSHPKKKKTKDSTQQAAYKFLPSHQAYMKSAHPSSNSKKLEVIAVNSSPQSPKVSAPQAFSSPLTEPLKVDSSDSQAVRCGPIIELKYTGPAIEVVEYLPKAQAQVAANIPDAGTTERIEVVEEAPDDFYVMDDSGLKPAELQAAPAPEPSVIALPVKDIEAVAILAEPPLILKPEEKVTLKVEVDSPPSEPVAVAVKDVQEKTSEPTTTLKTSPSSEPESTALAMTTEALTTEVSQQKVTSGDNETPPQSIEFSLLPSPSSLIASSFVVLTSSETEPIIISSTTAMPTSAALVATASVAPQSGPNEMPEVVRDSIPNGAEPTSVNPLLTKADYDVPQSVTILLQTGGEIYASAARVTSTPITIGYGGALSLALANPANVLLSTLAGMQGNNGQSKSDSFSDLVAVLAAVERSSAQEFRVAPTTSGQRSFNGQNPFSSHHQWEEAFQMVG